MRADVNNLEAPATTSWRTIAEKMSKPLAAADRIENRTGDRSTATARSSRNGL